VQTTQHEKGGLAEGQHTTTPHGPQRIAIEVCFGTAVVEGAACAQTLPGLPCPKLPCSLLQLLLLHRRHCRYRCARHYLVQLLQRSSEQVHHFRAPEPRLAQPLEQRHTFRRQRKLHVPAATDVALAATVATTTATRRGLGRCRERRGLRDDAQENVNYAVGNAVGVFVFFFCRLFSFEA
jgi:hypothetical protein